MTVVDVEKAKELLEGGMEQAGELLRQPEQLQDLIDPCLCQSAEAFLPGFLLRLHTRTPLTAALPGRRRR